MAPLGPAPEIVSKLKSRDRSLPRRNCASWSAASISLRGQLAACFAPLTAPVASIPAQPAENLAPARAPGGVPPPPALFSARVLAPLRRGERTPAAHDARPRRSQSIEDPGCGARRIGQDAA